MARKRKTTKLAAVPKSTAVARLEPEEPTIGRANVNRTVVRAEPYALLYANDVQIQTTPWDVRLVLGRILELPTKENPTATISQVGEIHISPQLAKRLTMLLIKQLDTYEKRMGEIPQPTD